MLSNRAAALRKPFGRRIDRCLRSSAKHKNGSMVPSNGAADPQRAALLRARSKRRVLTAGRLVRGCSFSRGALYHLLRDRFYRGEVAHRGRRIPVSTRPSSTRSCGTRSRPGLRSGELIAAEHGLGQALAYLQSTFNIDGVIGLLLVLALLGPSVTAVMSRAERPLLAWQ
jgi:hypothetical protein